MGLELKEEIQEELSSKIKECLVFIKKMKEAGQNYDSASENSQKTTDELLKDKFAQEEMANALETERKRLLAVLEAKYYKMPIKGDDTINKSLKKLDYAKSIVDQYLKADTIEKLTKLPEVDEKLFDEIDEKIKPETEKEQKDQQEEAEKIDKNDTARQNDSDTSSEEKEPETEQEETQQKEAQQEEGEQIDAAGEDSPDAQSEEMKPEQLQEENEQPSDETPNSGVETKDAKVSEEKHTEQERPIAEDPEEIKDDNSPAGSSKENTENTMVVVNDGNLEKKPGLLKRFFSLLKKPFVFIRNFIKNNNIDEETFDAKPNETSVTDNAAGQKNEFEEGLRETRQESIEKMSVKEEKANEGNTLPSVQENDGKGDSM